MKLHQIVLTAIIGIFRARCDETCDIALTNDCTARSTCSRRSARDPTTGMTDGYWSYYNFFKYNCRCDSLCHDFGDCCNDKMMSEDDENVTDIINDVMECIYPKETSSIGMGVYFVKKCPAGYKNENIRLKCESAFPNDVYSNWPITDNNGILYKNMHCAFCNDVTDYVQWNIEFGCSASVTNGISGHNSSWIMRYLYTSPECNATFRHPSESEKVGARVCKPNINTCDAAWPDDCVRHLCEASNASYSLVYNNTARIAYRNKYCAQCNYVQQYECRDEYTKAGADNALLNDMKVYPISILVDMNSHKMTGSKVGQGDKERETYFEDVIKTCALYHVYDPTADQCREIYTEHSCVDTNNTGACTEVVDDKDGCVYLELNVTDYAILLNGDLFDFATNLSYTNDSYRLLSNGIALVCTNLTQNHTISVEKSKVITHFKFDKTQAIVSLIGQLLSIIALSIHLTVYSCLPVLRNLAGKNLMCLVGALLLAQLLFLVGLSRTEVHSACVVLAVAIHYCFLATFFWMNVMSYDIWHTFSRTRYTSDNDAETRKFKRYLIYGWVSPLVVVLVALILNYSLAENSDFRPAYGEGLCWIIHRRSLVVLFGIPLLLLVSTNVLFYILTVISIYRVSESSKVASQTHQQKNICQVVLYVKLCVIMGLTWVFAFIATLTDITSIWYLFIVLNSLQGVFICLTFVLTPKVIRLLREKFGKYCKNIRLAGSRDDVTASSQSTRFTRTLSSDVTLKVSNENLHGVRVADVKVDSFSSNV